jgi:uncharacterized membrane protein
MIGFRPAAAEERPLICFGNEPSWSVTLVEPGVARLSCPDAPPVAYRGSAKRIEPIRGVGLPRQAGGRRGGLLVAFLRESTCSDGMWTRGRSHMR